MTDYVQGFAYEDLMVRDVGPYNVEFWFYAHDQSVTRTNMTFKVTANGSTGTFIVTVPAYYGWYKVATYNISTTQFVTFESDTFIGPGGSLPGPPDSYNVHILRSVPDPPGQPTLSNIKVNAMDVSWTPAYPGSSPITGYQLGYGTDSFGPTTIISASSPTTVINLATGTVYYFWARAISAFGTGNWSAAGSARTYLGAYVNVAGVWKLAIPYINVAGVWKQAEPIVSHI